MSDEVNPSLTAGPGVGADARPAAPGLPQHYGAEPSGPGRVVAVAAVVAAHLAAGWGLLQIQAVRDAVGLSQPVEVELITVAPPPPPKPLPPPPPPPSPPKPRPKEPPPPAPIVTTAPTPAPAPFVAPPPPVEPPPPPAPVVAPAPPAPAAPPAPPAPPAEPRMLPSSAVRYLVPPSPVYPMQSKRLGESGKVKVRVLIDTQGRAAQVQIQSSSSYRRLDEAALSAVRGARFQPHVENGQARPIMVDIDINFEMEE